MIEVLTVCFIISILAAMSVVLIARAKAQSREVAALGTLSAFTTAYEAYRFRYSEYPQWGPGQRFGNPKALVDFLMDEDFLPTVYRSSYEYFPAQHLFKGFADDYFLQILSYNPAVATSPPKGSYFIILVPYGFQKRYLAAIFDPTEGALTVRARKGDANTAFAKYGLFTFKDPPLHH